jgi:hypothetical protein
MIKYTPTLNRKPLEAGIHPVSVKLATESYSNKGDQTIELELLVGDDKHPMRDTLYNTDKAAWRITQARDCFGFMDEIGEEIEFKAVDLHDCTGQVEIALGEPRKSGKYEGQQFMEVKRYLPRIEHVAVEPDVENVPF